MNVYDSNRILDVLKGSEYFPTDSPENATLILINTCHIREKAAEKLYSDLGRYHVYKQKRKRNGEDSVIAVAGCVGQAEGEQVFSRAPFVDIVVGPQSYHELPSLLDRAISQNRRGFAETRVLAIQFPQEKKFDYLPKVKANGFSAFITVQEGCDKFCTFCVVPYTRGSEYSRPFDELLEEANILVSQGVREITLLGQNVNAYHGLQKKGSVNSIKLAELLRGLNKIRDLEVIRYTTSHPRDMTNDLIKAHGELEKLAPFLHLPVQSGSDRILKKMNRKHTISEYLDVVDKLVKVRPELKLSSDFIVGFPGETDKDFADTLRLVNDLDIVQAYSFKFSARPGTPASLDSDQVPEEKKGQRLRELQELIGEKQIKFNNSCIGSRLRVLLDRPGRKKGQLSGRTPYMQAAHVDAPGEYLGKFVEIKVIEAYRNSLGGVMEKSIKEKEKLFHEGEVI